MFVLHHADQYAPKYQSKEIVLDCRLIHNLYFLLKPMLLFLLTKAAKVANVIYQNHKTYG